MKSKVNEQWGQGRIFPESYAKGKNMRIYMAYGVTTDFWHPSINVRKGKILCGYLNFK